VRSFEAAVRYANKLHSRCKARPITKGQKPTTICELQVVPSCLSVLASQHQQFVSQLRQRLACIAIAIAIAWQALQRRPQLA